MAKKSPKGEMPFLDHLEELRWRILWSGIALIVGSVIGFYLVTRFDVPSLLMVPIQPHLSGERLVFTRPTDAFLITLKLSVIVGAVIASPVIFRQAWGFLAPALYERERRMVMPAILAGVGLFVSGAWMAYLWVLPAILRIMLSERFLGTAFEAFITAGEYFKFATQVILAFGFVFQLPLVMVLLSAMRLVSPRFFARNRPYAFLIGAMVAAFVTPPDVFSMLMMMAPIIVLYEVGIGIGRVIWKRQERAANTLGSAGLMVILVGLALAAPEAAAQQPVRPDSTRQRDSSQVAVDSLGAERDSTLADSLAAAAADTAGPRVELPTGPSRPFPTADSIIQALLAREGYRPTRYAADRVTFHALTRQIDLRGAALVEREGRISEADSIQYVQEVCALHARGDPKLFDRGTTVVGEQMDYDTCLRRGVVSSAITTFKQQGVDWYMRGNLGIDSGSTRLYAGRGNMTSSERPDPDYHFAVGKMKWVTNNIMVARPVILYVRDVPVMWLPFMFQDMRQGRRSGLLTPRFGINDIVRPNEGYRRHISNIGYYFALNDYTDVQASLDWFAETSVSINTQARYRWLDRFVTGGIGVGRVFESGNDDAPGRRTTRLNWTHQQQFNQRTRLNANVDFSTSTRVLRENAVDPFLQTGQLRSTVNFSKQQDWGTITLGGSRVQQIANEVVTEVFPDVRLTPVPISVGTDLTWSPSFSFQTQRTLNQPSGLIDVPPIGGLPLQDSLFSDSRRTNMALATPIRIGRWNLQNSFTVTDVLNKQRSTQNIFLDPADTTQLTTRVYGEDFSTEIDWNTGINLPMLFPATWKLQPSVGMRNKTGGAFLLRNRFTNGEFVQQGKRVSFSAGISPSVFGFFPGLGPVARIRHAVSPSFSWGYSPTAEVSPEYLRARDPGNPNPQLQSPAIHTVGLSGISQTFEGKYATEDSTDTQDARKVKLLSIQTSGFQYDFEQAKEPGRNGFTTSGISNSFTSDLLRGFSMRTRHDLWDGPVGYDTTRFDPFLSSVAASFTINGSTIGRLFGALFGGQPLPPPSAEEVEADSLDAAREEEEFFSPPRPLGRTTGFPAAGSATRGTRGRGFSASIRYNDRRTRRDESREDFGTPSANRNLGVTMSFSPTRNWQLQWTTDYNLTTKEFGSNSLRFERDLRRWRATFAFVQAPNGNFAFNFFIQLLDLTEVKFNYDQRTVNR